MTLFWDRMGRVACAAHAPVKDPGVWAKNGWREIAPTVISRGRLRCPDCAYGSTIRSGKIKAANNLYGSIHRDIAQARGRSTKNHTDAPLFEKEQPHDD